ncbi:hypothetical protein GCM10023149_37210 [Mucilaginibacter gynuensis]|uniref:Glycosyl transferase family 1 domain-containing protein n=1 Tax=Mucilaginibacter gynuensis TaxID=1302236 RepID=A0ABP8GXM1_9SPHI
MKKRVLFSIYQTENHSNGGVNSMSQIMEQDVSVVPYIITNIHGPFNVRWEARRWIIKVTSIKWGGTSSSPFKIIKLFDLLKSNLAAYRMLKRNKIDTLYCNDIQGFWCSYYGGLLAGVKVIFNLRDTKSADELYSLKKWKYIASKADVIVVLSKEMKEFVVNKLLVGSNSDKVVVTYSIVNQEVFHPVNTVESKKLREYYEIAEEEFVVSYVAAFNAKKAQLLFIKNVVSKFRDTNNITFNFIGDFDINSNSYAADCLNEVRSLGLESLVKFVGHVVDVDKWYKMSNLVAIASNKEGLARCMIEAISCGTPVISFDVCSANEILAEYKTGEVVPMSRYDIYTQKLKNLISDRNLLKEYSNNGFKVASELFNKDTVLKRYKGAYHVNENNINSTHD